MPPITSKLPMWVCPHCFAAFVEGSFCPVDGATLCEVVFSRELGRGLTGTVWQARWIDGQIVAIKVLHREWADHHEMRARFLREARAAATVSHPAVVSPLAAGELADTRPYLVMELVEGPSLEEVLALGPLPEARAILLAQDLAGGLAACHRAGVVHRDVKPGNVRIGGDGRARLLDFGVARQLDIDEARLTQGGMAIGTPHYMAPEQCSGDVVGTRADVYALGCLIYRMISGEVPFDGTAVAVMLAHATRAPVPLGERAVVTPALDRLVARCLAKRPGDRPDAEELDAELDRIAHGAPTRARAIGRAATVPADPAPLPSRARSVMTAPESTAAPRPTVAESLPRRRHRLRKALVGVVVGAAVLVLFNATDVGHRLAHRVGIHFHPDVPMLRGPQSAEAEEPPPAPNLPPEPKFRRFLTASDGGVALRLGTPATIVAGREAELTVEAWNADGDPIETTDLVVAFEGPAGAPVGYAAEPTRTGGLYRVRIQFDAGGPWTVRAFPPIGESMVTFTIDVREAI